ncbi:hypothetical protein BYT27DRAFT_6746137 [Phlegmacium glaucopus]|nr:hypothetical protein BYT27DRAFT_6746137 [Phlegmacium glaucopus]
MKIPQIMSPLCDPLYSPRAHVLIEQFSICLPTPSTPHLNDELDEQKSSVQENYTPTRHLPPAPSLYPGATHVPSPSSTALSWCNRRRII